MKNKDDKQIEKLVENLMAESTVESPSVDFTTRVMSAISAVEKSKNLVYKPLISKRIWFIIFAIIASVFGFLIFNTQPSSANSYFNFTVISFDKFLKPFSGLKFSTMTTNVLLAASVMLFIQIFLLKIYLNKRFHK